ncbi:discoidin domain-containing protein [Ideonella sp. BN130291]|uniref:discoidin domain-containing protein n=1 Tax=Ideonella sp. BN130291 TaxID=3112940 RepID=UPI002E2689E1|nr:discoidin domain-containing protein [Ideonella sp. BN130291]
MRAVRRSMVALLLAACGLAGAAPQRVLDDFRQPGGWTATASDQVSAQLRSEGARGLCLDYDFNGVSGYAVLRRELPLQLPANYQFELRLRGEGPLNDFQFKLVDASGDNVWWVNRPQRRFEPAGTTLRLKKRHISFAWGPTQDKVLRQAAAIELVVVAARGGGGKGSVCFERLSLTKLPVAEPPPLAPIRWQAPAGRRSLALDLGAVREFNGLLLRWQPGLHAGDYDVEASEDTRHWRTLRSVRNGDGHTDTLFLPESEARHLRLRVLRGPGTRYALDALALRSAAQWPGLNAMLTELAASQPRGWFPRAFHGEQNYWTVVGVDGGGSQSALMSEDGAIELAPGGPSVEPFVLLDGTGGANGGAGAQLVAWPDVQIGHRLREGYLPMPAVQWRHAAFTLDVEAAGDGSRSTAQLLTRYTLHNPGDRPLKATLVLALRPWQVNPPQQFLSTPGGVSPVRQLQWADAVLQVNGQPALRPLRPPTAVSAAAFDSVSPLAALQAGMPLPPLTRLQDPNALASAVLTYRLDIPAHGSRQVTLMAPLAGPLPTAPLDEAALQARFDAVAAHWRERLNRVALQLPAAARPLHDSLRSALAHILLSRNGPALQPGTRSYQRTWVRDGAMMVAGLLRLGEVPAAREFVQWYAQQLFANGKVPCCVDARGADPVVENDSSGEFLYAVAELWRHTHDRALLERLWPQVEAATQYMEGLRQSQRTPAQQQPGQQALWGLMPASISHEGYSDKPMHSYWDDFWALRGYKDAVQLAQASGHAEAARRWAGWRDEFERELMASIRTSAAQHRIGFVPGAAELGDFDATSTTVALNPAQAQAALPPELLAATFERYWQEAVARRDGQRAWKDYTPYELRTVGSFVRLQQPERAHALLGWFFGHQRPAGWNQWAEVVLPDAREPRFLGDMPHAWVSSDYLRSALDLLAYEREADGTLVLAGGVLPAWLDEGVAVDGLSTPWGRLGYRLKREAGRVRLDIGAGVAPPGGFVLRWQGRDVHIPSAPATVWLDEPR